MPFPLVAAYSIIAGIALVLSLLAPLVLRPLLARRGVIDVPNARSSHKITVVRGLGIGVWIAISVAWLVAIFAGAFNGQITANGFTGGQLATAVIVFAGFNFAALIGLLEDLVGLSVLQRSVLQMLLAVGVAGALLWQLWGKLPLWVLLLLLVFGVLYISSFVNVANFMDGLNGISALHAIVAGLAFLAIGVIDGTAWLIIGGALLVAGFAGFLPWNLSGRGFLGDVGSYLLGGSIIALSFAALCDGVPILAAIGPTVVYFGDVGWTLIKRIKRGEIWHEAHKEHVYQRVQQAGASHLTASALTAGCTAVAAFLGILSYAAPNNFLWQGVLLAGGLIVVIAYLNLPRLYPIVDELLD